MTLPDCKAVIANHPEFGNVGELYWQAEDTSIGMGGDKPRKVLHEKGEIRQVVVPPEYQRNGVATALWNYAQRITPELHHSTNISDAGSAWSQSL
jgi:hypothetical protein